MFFACIAIASLISVKVKSDRFVMWLFEMHRNLPIMPLPKNQHLASCQYRSQIPIY